jgi:hypothetical protein
MLSYGRWNGTDGQIDRSQTKERETNPPPLAASQRSAIVKSDPLVSLLPALRAFCALLKKSKKKGMVIGGVASSLLGRPRLTADIDATVVLDDASIDLFLRQAFTQGFIPRRPDSAAFLRRSAMLLLTHRASGVPVDIAQGLLPFERDATSRAIMFKIKDLSVPLPRPEDLVIMKALAHRPQDIEDIRGIVAANPGIEIKQVRKEVMAFAKMLDMPDLWDDIAGIFTHKSKRKTRLRKKK